MIDITTARTALQTNLRTIADLECYRIWPEQINPPAACVSYGGGDAFLARHTFDRTWRAQFDVQVIVSLAGGYTAAQDALDAYLDQTGSSSIVVAIESDATLNSSCDYCQVLSVTVPGFVDVAGVSYLSATWRVEAVG